MIIIIMEEEEDRSLESSCLIVGLAFSAAGASSATSLSDPY